uniref:Fibrinogen C-terminal domain-containing protein n=2 Tax=Macrostomum lignano TaxID=282301 RepID=A0A1I8IMW6_9PLAT
SPSLQTAGSDCWTTVQHRVYCYRNWTQYQSEFGELGPDENYWIGLNPFSRSLRRANRKLRILMKAWNESESWAEYSSFSVGAESDNYRLQVLGSDGIGDSLSYSSGSQFSTKDADHDDSSSSCAERYAGGWWFRGCYSTHPNGVYKNFTDAIGGPFGHVIIWKYRYGFYYSR